jgi:hypothetical protein
MNSTIGQDLGFPKSRDGHLPDPSLVLPRDYLGLEFEFENVTQGLDPTLDWVGLVRNKEDGSLRNNGQEFIFSQPLFGKDATDTIKGLCEEATRLGWQTSLRTGIHVHVDARDITYEQMRWWLIFNALLEPAIYRWVGDGRDESVFCLPWYSTDAVLPLVRKIYNTEGAELGAAAHALAHKKYSGLNLDCLRRFGSIEYRHLRTTTEAARVLRWVNICLRFKAASAEMVKVLSSVASKITPEEWLGGGAVLDLGTWRLILKEQAEDLMYPDFLRDIKNKGLPTALEIVRKYSIFPRLSGKANSLVARFLGTKAPKAAKGDLDTLGLLPIPPAFGFDQFQPLQWDVEQDAPESGIWNHAHFNAAVLWLCNNFRGLALRDLYHYVHDPSSNEDYRIAMNSFLPVLYTAYTSGQMVRDTRPAFLQRVKMRADIILDEFGYVLRAALPEEFV